MQELCGSVNLAQLCSQPLISKAENVPEIFNLYTPPHAVNYKLA